MSREDPTIRLGAFELETLIGEGGMASVWRARHDGSDTRVAIKVLSEARSNREGIIRFEREVEAVAGLNHPGVVDVYDYGRVSDEEADVAQADGIDEIRAGHPYLAMELAEGGSLAEAGPVTRWPALRSLLLHLLDALAYAHAREVIHRDIKPDNVLLFDIDDVTDTSSPDSRPKLTDFGIAHALGPEAAEQSNLDISETAGTPHFMPPEQLRAQWRDFGPWTDLYALGTMAYELTCARPPFEGESFMVLATKHLEEPPPDLQPTFPVPEGFEKWIHRLLEKNPTHRFETAADAAAHLEALPRLEAEPESPSTDETEQTTTNKDSADLLGRADTIESPLTDTHVLSTDSLPSAEEPSEQKDHTPDSRPPGTNPAVPSTLSHSDLSSVSETIGEDDEPAPRRITTRRSPPAQVVPKDWRRPASPSKTTLSGIGLGLFGVRTPPMVDREEVRDDVWAQLRRAQSDGSVELALLEGNAGLGKSRVAADIARRARELGCARVLRCSHSSLGGPLSGVGRLLEYLFVTWELDGQKTLKRVRNRLKDIYRGTRREHDERFLDDEAALLVGWMRPTSEQAGRLASRRASYEAIRRLFNQLTRDRPLIVILDDLQWGSEALGLCEHLLGSAGTERDERASLPVLLLGTLDRDAEPVVGVEEKLEGLRSASDGVTHREVAGLDVESHRELVDDLLDLTDDLSGEVARRSAGHPLFAIQLVSDMVDREQLATTSAGFQLRSEGVSLPTTLGAVWRRRLNYILDDDQNRAAIEQAAALGRTVYKEEWRDACERAGLADAPDAVAALRRRGLVTDDDQQMTFTHHSFREAIAAQAQKAGRWRDHHRRCAETLESLYPAGTRGVARRIASHLTSAGMDQAAIGPLLDAVGEAYEFGDYQLAAELLDRWNELLEGSERSDAYDRQVARGDLWRARLAHRRGESDTAESVLSDVLERSQRHGWESLTVEGMLMLIDRQLDAGEPDRALNTATTLREEIDATIDRDDRANLWAKLGRIHFERGSLTDARHSLTRARSIWEEADDDSNVARIDVHIANTFIADGQLERAEEILENALPIARRVGARFTEAHCMNCLGELARHREQYDRARDYYRQASDLWELTGDRDAAVAQLNQGLTSLEAGHYADAFETLTDARDMLEDHGMQQLLPPAAIGRAAHLVTRGDIDSAGQSLQRGIRIAEETQHLSRDFADLVEHVAELCRQNAYHDWAERLEELAHRQRETLNAQSR